MTCFLCIYIFLHFVSYCNSFSNSNSIDPNDYFIGAQVRPRLTILKPGNGAILDDGNLEINLSISGYDLPSSFHDSKVCVALSAAMSVAEECFEQTPDLIYHVSGLTPGTQYSLRVAFYERGKAIAVSVRSFLCAGIQIEDAYAPVTIQNAVQLAVQYQNKKMTAEAERIYRKVLSENPRHQHGKNII